MADDRCCVMAAASAVVIRRRKQAEAEERASTDMPAIPKGPSLASTPAIRNKTHKTAVCIIPPSTLWTPIQEIRAAHDKVLKKLPFLVQTEQSSC